MKEISYKNIAVSIVMLILGFSLFLYNRTFRQSNPILSEMISVAAIMLIVGSPFIRSRAKVTEKKDEFYWGIVMLCFVLFVLAAVLFQICF